MALSHPADHASLVLSLNRALLGEVSCRLRCVAAATENSEIELYCFFDGEISEDDKESMSSVAGYVAGDFPEYIVSEQCVRLDAPERIPDQRPRHVVFLRKERRGTA